MVGLLRVGLLVGLLGCGHGACPSHRATNASAAVDALNARFASGKPTNHLHYAGVVLRAYDGDPRHHPPGNVSCLTSGPHPAGVISASIVNLRVPYAYAGNGDGRPQIGVVLSSAAASAALSCAYPRDAASIYVRCVAGAAGERECVPGCVGTRLTPRATPNSLARNRWCSSSIGTDISDPGGPLASPSECAWRAADLSTAMALHEQWASKAMRPCAAGPYVRSPWCACARQRPCCQLPHCPLFNELILQSAPLSALTATHGAHETTPVEAVYYAEAGVGGSEAAARALHAELGRRALASSPTCSIAVPLVAVNFDRGERPFTLVGQ